MCRLLFLSWSKLLVISPGNYLVRNISVYGAVNILMKKYLYHITVTIVVIQLEASIYERMLNMYQFVVGIV